MMGFVGLLVLLVLALTYYKFLLKACFAVALIGSMIWLLYNYFWKIVMGLGVVVLLCVVWQIWCGVKRRRDFDSIKSALTSGNSDKAIKLFLTNDDEFKKSVLEYAHNITIKNKEDVLERMFISDFVDFSQKRKTVKSNTILFEKENIESYLQSVWASSGNEFRLTDAMTLMPQYLPDYDVTEETPEGAPTLIRIARRCDIFNCADFDLDSSS